MILIVKTCEAHEHIMWILALYKNYFYYYYYYYYLQIFKRPDEREALRVTDDRFLNSL